MEVIDLEMKCDICKYDQNEVLILRHHRFTNKGLKVHKKVHRVCFSCAKGLIRKHEYDFGAYWVEVFYYIMHRVR